MLNSERQDILIIVDGAFPISETFIYRQVLALSKIYNIHLLANSRQNEGFFPIVLSGYLEFQTWLNPVDRILSAILRRVNGSSDKLSYSFKSKVVKYIERNDIKVVQIHYGTLAVKYNSILSQIDIPYIVSFHGFDASKALLNESYATSISGVCQKAFYSLLSSPHMVNNLRLRDVNSKFKVIPYGIDVQEFSPTGKAQSDEESVHILHSGRITPKKGVPDLIQTFGIVKDMFPKIHLHILGDGNELALCKSLSRDLDLSESITFYGAKPIDKVKELMNDCDIFVLNSRIAEDGDMEGLPNALLEAMSMGMAVLSTRHAGIPMAVKHMDNGLLVNEHDTDELVKMLSLLISDGSLRDRFGQEAKKTIQDSFSLSKMSDSILDVYKELPV